VVTLSLVQAVHLREGGYGKQQDFVLPSAPSTYSLLTFRICTTELA
jgi:hypothetical protein